jgi:hypothetical protein
MMRYTPKELCKALVYIGAIGGMAAWVSFVVPPDLGATIFSGPLGLALVGYTVLLLQKTIVKIDQAVHFIRIHHNTTVYGYLTEKLIR